MTLREQVANILLIVANDKYYGRYATAYESALHAADVILALPGITAKEPEPEEAKNG